jgi:hypothetical protein
MITVRMAHAITKDAIFEEDIMIRCGEYDVLSALVSTCLPGNDQTTSMILLLIHPLKEVVDALDGNDASDPFIPHLVGVIEAIDRVSDGKIIIPDGLQALAKSHPHPHSHSHGDE